MWTPIETDAADLIHDVSYDYYGRRMVTCSSDRTLKVFDLDEAGNWHLADSWKAADASIIKCVWAHPEHGQVVACCSIDRTVRIFEECGGDGKRWVERARLVDARAAVHDIWFAPHHQGLRLASVAADGIVRIYEALEPNNLSHWTLMDDFSVLDSGSSEEDGDTAMSKMPPRESEASFCLTWCPSRFAQPSLAVGSMDTVRLYVQDGASGKWRSAGELPHPSLIRDITWAPSMGRSWHQLATACKDGHVRIFKLTEQDGTWQAQCIGDFDDHGQPVWRVSFNVTGTILSSAGDDAKIRLWKSSYGGQFACTSVVSMIQS
jgi:nucleoporin SEH1